MPAKPTRLFRVKHPFIANEEGREISYLVNNRVYSEDHYMVKRNPGAFEEVIFLGLKNPVEAATANPGEVRTVSKP